MGRQTRKNRTNEEWVATLRGDAGGEAQAAAYQDLANYLYKVAYNYLRLRRDSVPRLANTPDEQLVALAEDFAQTALVKVALNQLYNTFRSDAKFTTYMAVIVRRVAAQALRRKEWSIYAGPLAPSESEYESGNSESLPSLPPELTDNPDPDVGPQLEELWDTVRWCVSQLPGRWRHAFVLNVFEGRPTSEVKEQVKASSEGAVHILVSRARSRLKKCLTDAGWNLNEVWQLFDK